MASAQLERPGDDAWEKILKWLDDLKYRANYMFNFDGYNDKARIRWSWPCMWACFVGCCEFVCFLLVMVVSVLVSAFIKVVLLSTVIAEFLAICFSMSSEVLVWRPVSSEHRAPLLEDVLYVSIAMLAGPVFVLVVVFALWKNSFCKQLTHGIVSLCKLILMVGLLIGCAWSVRIHTHVSDTCTIARMYDIRLNAHINTYMHTCIHKKHAYLPACKPPRPPPLSLFPQDTRICLPN
jgi:hypothetical protein